MNATVRKFPRRRILAIAIGALALSGTAIAIVAKETAPQHPQKVRAIAASLAVKVLSPAAASFDRVVAATGTISARDELIVGSDASGVRLTDVLVDIGSVVSKGQLLAQADDRELQAQWAQHEAMVRQSQADYEQAASNLERAETLRDSGVYSVEVIETRRTSAAAAAAKLDLARAQRMELEVKIAHTRVVAPADGVISHRTATVGAVIQPGAELFRLIKDGELEWRAELPSHSLSRVRAGDRARVTLDDGSTLDAKVRMIAPTIDASTRNGRLHVALPAGTRLRAGGHARGEILVDSDEALSVPEASVVTRDGYAYVYVIGADDVAHLTRIETGDHSRGLVEVTGGLPSDARVVSTGAGFVKDGELVRVSPDSQQQLARAGVQS